MTSRVWSTCDVLRSAETGTGLRKPVTRTILPGWTVPGSSIVDGERSRHVSECSAGRRRPGCRERPLAGLIGGQQRTTRLVHGPISLTDVAQGGAAAVGDHDR